MIINNEDKILKEFSKYGTATIADAMGRYGAMAPYIRPIESSMKLCGRALTVKTYRSDNLMMHIALEMAERGVVLVVDAGGVTNAGLWGDLMTRMAILKGLNGLVIDGAIRDSEDIIKLGFPVFAKSTSPMGGFKKSPGSVNTTVSCGNTCVNTDDIIIGDRDGVVVIPKDKEDTVLSKCRKIKEKEENIIHNMENGKSLFNCLDLKSVSRELGFDLGE